MILAVYIALGILIFAVAAQQLGAALDRRKYPPPGKMIGGLHLFERGETNAGPVVVLEAGIAASSLSWWDVQKRIAQHARVVSYDRAGLGWSESHSGARGAEAAVAELRTLLRNTAIPPPYILVGHSFGGYAAARYAARFPEEIAGIILVDPPAAADWYPMSTFQRARLARGIRLSRRGAWLAHLGVVRVCLWLLIKGMHRVPRWFARKSTGGASIAERLTGEVGKLPREVWPMVRAHWCLPKSFEGMAAHLESFAADAELMSRTTIPSHIPVTVLSAETASPNAMAEHVARAAESLHGYHRVAEGSGHWILFDEPELIVEAVQNLRKVTK